MSTLSRCRCRRCSSEFQARWGGGFRYVDRFCRRCGGWRCLRFAEDPRTWEAFLAWSETFQEPRRPLRERQRRMAESTARLEEQVQAVLGPCPCGGAFTEERPRCPDCGDEDLEFVGDSLTDYD